jgi:hypothetical protein
LLVISGWLFLAGYFWLIISGCIFLAGFFYLNIEVIFCSAIALESALQKNMSLFVIDEH